MLRQKFTGYHGMNLVADGAGDPAHPVVIMMYGSGQTRGSWSGTESLLTDLDCRYRWHWDPEFQHWNRRNNMCEKIGPRMAAASVNCKVPTLLIRGGSSELVDEEGVEHLLSLLPRGEAYLVEKAGHMVAGDRNDIFNAGIAPFVRRVLSARFD